MGLDIRWAVMPGEMLNLVQPSLRVIGIDKHGEVYVSAEYGRDLTQVMIERYLDDEPRVEYQGVLFVRVNWLLERFPQCVDAFKSFDLPFV